MHRHVFLVLSDHLMNYGHGKWWDEQERRRDAVAKLQELRRSEVDTIVNQTLPGNGRDVARLASMAAEVDLNIVVTTSYHILDDLPQHYQWRSPNPVSGKPDLLVQDFVHDIVNGIADTDVRAGLLKCCVNVKGMTSG